MSSQRLAYLCLASARIKDVCYHIGSCHSLLFLFSLPQLKHNGHWTSLHCCCCRKLMYTHQCISEWIRMQRVSGTIGQREHHISLQVIILTIIVVILKYRALITSHTALGPTVTPAGFPLIQAMLTLTATASLMRIP